MKKTEIHCLYDDGFGGCQSLCLGFCATASLEEREIIIILCKRSPRRDPRFDRLGIRQIFVLSSVSKELSSLVENMNAEQKAGARVFFWIFPISMVWAGNLSVSCIHHCGSTFFSSHWSRVIKLWVASVFFRIFRARRDKIVFPSSVARDSTLDRAGILLPKKNIKVLANGVIGSLPTIDLLSGKVVDILIAGRFDDSKDWVRAINIADRVAGIDGNKLKVRLVGRGAKNASLQIGACQRKDRWSDFEIFEETESIGQHYKASKLVLFCAKPLEGFGNVAFECMEWACVPVVNHDSAPGSILQSRKLGLVFDSDIDAVELINNFLSCAEDEVWANHFENSGGLREFEVWKMTERYRVL